MSSEIKVDTISENTSANGVVIDGVTLKDNGITATTLGVGNTKDLGDGIHIKISDTGASTNTGFDELVIEKDSNCGISILSGNDDGGAIIFGDDGDADIGNIFYNHASDAMEFTANAQQIFTIHSSGVVFNEGAANQNFRVESTVNTHQFFVDADQGTCHIGTTNVAPGISNTDDGIAFNQNGRLFVNAAANTFSQFATDGDGNILSFASAGTGEGVISISGTTTTYGGFTGTHWSRLADNSKPTILRGTLMESLDEMCDWYQAVADVAEVKYTAEDEEVKSGSKNVGDVKEPAYKKRVPITLPDGKAVGDAVTFTFQGETHTGVYEKETDIKHVKCKISDTTDSKKIYGLFSHWDSGFDYLDDDVNDMNIAQVGTFIIRVNKDVTVEAGDLLVSNGDGTAKLQDDDIIRSKTVAKVNSNIKVETYEDGSYTVPCTLHC